MSAEMIERTYGHQHPDYMRGTAPKLINNAPNDRDGVKPSAPTGRADSFITPPL
jgi:hypothetical protein